MIVTWNKCWCHPHVLPCIDLRSMTIWSLVRIEHVIGCWVLRPLCGSHERRGMVNIFIKRFFSGNHIKLILRNGIPRDQWWPHPFKNKPKSSISHTICWERDINDKTSSLPEYLSPFTSKVSCFSNECFERQRFPTPRCSPHSSFELNIWITSACKSEVNTLTWLDAERSIRRWKACTPFSSIFRFFANRKFPKSQTSEKFDLSTLGVDKEMEGEGQSLHAHIVHDIRIEKKELVPRSGTLHFFANLEVFSEHYIILRSP